MEIEARTAHDAHQAAREKTERLMAGGDVTATLLSPKDYSFMEFRRNPIRFMGRRLVSLFRDEPSLAEFSSGCALILYGLFLLLGKGPEDWPSLDLLTDVFPGYWWAAMALAGGFAQLSALIFRIRFLRIAAATGCVIWIFQLTFLTWPLFPWSPLIALSLAWSLPNLVVIFRHARDWR